MAKFEISRGSLKVKGEGGWRGEGGLEERVGARDADGETPPRPRNNNSGDNVSRQIAQSVNQHKHR